MKTVVLRILGMCFAALLLAVSLLTSKPANAAVWRIPNGVWVSDTCVTPTGQWFTFYNTYGRVGDPCYFVVNGFTFYGRFG